MLFVKVVESEDGGVILTKVTNDIKTSTVFLGVEAWNQLTRYQYEAHKALEIQYKDVQWYTRYDGELDSPEKF